MNRRSETPPRSAPSWDPLQVGVAAMLLTYAWRIHEVLPGLQGLKLLTLVTLGTLVAAFLRGPRPRSFRNLSHPAVVAVGVFVLTMVLSLPGAILQAASFEFIATTFTKTLFLFAIVLFSVRGPVDVERYTAVLVLGGVVYTATVLALYNTGGGAGFERELTYFDENGTAMVSVCTLPMAFYFALRGSRWWYRAAAMIGGLVLVVGIMESGSRAGILGLGALCLYFLIAFREISVPVRAVVAALLVVGSLTLGASQVRDTVRTVTNPTEDYNWAGNSETGRIEIWKRGVGYMVSNPLGVGARGFNAAEGYLAPNARSEEVGEGWKWSAAHNTFVQVGAEMGVFGLLAFLAILGLTYRGLRRVERRARADPAIPDRFGLLSRCLVASLLLYCLTGFLLSQAYIGYLWGFLGIAVGLDVGLRSRVPAATERESPPAPAATVR